VSKRRTLAALATLLGLACLLVVAGGTAAGGTKRERWDTKVLALVPFPGYPARAYVHPNGRIYVGTYESDAGAAVPSRLFEYTGPGRLVRSFTIKGQHLGATHGIQAAISDSRGRMVVLDTNPARVLTVNLRNRKQRTYARFPDLPSCPGATADADCTETTNDSAPIPNYAAWGRDGSLYVTDYGQASVWRVPPGGGKPELWLTSKKLDGVEFGTTGISLAADAKTLLVGQSSSAGMGDGDPTTGKIYEVPIKADGSAGSMTKLWESQPTDLPDGFAIARSGRIYVPMVGLTAQIAVVSPEGKELERFPDQPLTGDNGSPVPFDNPSSVAFLGTRLIVANQSVIQGDTSHMALLDVEVQERGLKPLIPKRAGFKPKHRQAG
jgi:sugar lactone lactonase YvrE